MLTCKPRPIWQDLPDDFKKNVVSNLDFRSRRHLQLCSTEDKKLIERCKLELSFIRLHKLDSGNFQLKIRDFCGFHFIHEYSPANALSLCLRLLKNPKVSVEFVKISLPVFKEFLAAVSDLPDFRIKCKIFFIPLNYDTMLQRELDQDSLGMLKLVQSKKFVVAHRYSAENLNEMVKLEQWKLARGMLIFLPSKYPIDPFLHLNSVRIHIGRLEPKDGKLLIQAFLKKTDVEHCSTFFQVNTEETLKQSRIIANHDSELKAVLVSDLEEPGILVQSFEMKHFPKYTFVVKCSKKVLMGSVCRPAPYLVSDFMESPDV